MTKKPSKMVTYTVKQTMFTNYRVIFAVKIIKITFEVELSG